MDHLNGHTRLQFKNLWRADIAVNRTFKEIDTRQLRGGPSLFIGGSTDAELFLQTNTSKDLFFGGGIEHTNFDDKISESKNYTFLAQWLINKRFNISSSTTYVDELNNHQYVMQPLVNKVRKYIVGTISRQTLYTTLRAELFVTPELSFQYYGSPYASSGKYEDYRNVTNADSEDIDKRYSSLIVQSLPSGKVITDKNNNIFYNFSNGNPDFNFQEFRSNFVARWEYKTGSTIYFVWTNNRSRYQSSYKPLHLKSFRSLSEGIIQNAFMIKFNYWFSL